MKQYSDEKSKEITSFELATFSDETLFTSAQFFGNANFNYVIFSGKALFGTYFFYEADFFRAIFSDEAIFSGEFKNYTKFHNVVFENGEKILFIVKDLSNVSFINTDITRVRFSENVHWEGKDGFKLIDEKELEESFEYLFTWNNIPTNYKDNHSLRNFLKDRWKMERTEYLRFVKEDKTISINDEIRPNSLSIILNDIDKNRIMIVDNKGSIRLNDENTEAILTMQSPYVEFPISDVFIVKKKMNKLKMYRSHRPHWWISLASIKAVYRALRENYEYRMRYDEAGRFFIREMELKRKYREVPSEAEGEEGSKIIVNGLTRRNLSLTGLYYNLFRYGEDLKRPALTLLLPLFILSTVYWGAINLSDKSFTNDGFALWLNATARTAFDMSQVERNNPQLVDNITRVISLGILGMLLIPLRRRFERKFRH